MSSTLSAPTAAPAGGAFLIEPASSAAVFTPEDFSEEHRQTRSTAERFINEEVRPVIAEYERKDEALARRLIRKCGELGLLAILTPEKYGGLEMDLTTQLIAAEEVGRYASFSVAYGAHSGIGSLPLAFFGFDEQKARYLPRMATGELLGAYCLSEPEAGSDALASRTRADLSDDGRFYALNGQKMWISNGAWADLYTVFAKVGGEKFSAFLVERSFEGVRPGAEEHKMGIRGSSTTALYLDNVRVPAENLLGEVGRGHVIAFNILNLGRLKLAASCAGGCKEVLAESIRYAKQRKAFGRPIADFGAIRAKLAEGAIRAYAAESMVYRTGGMIDARLADLDWNDAAAARTVLGAIEEYAVECAVAKVYGTEALDYVCDEGVQIHGGYGFHEDYMVERAYRDSRINRIFEGTNEINRLLTTGMLLKRATQGRLALRPAIERLAANLSDGDVPPPDSDAPLAEERRLAERGKKALLLAAGAASERFGAEIEEQQEVAAALADAVIAVYAMESALLRAEKLATSGKGEQAADMTRALVRTSLAEIASRAAEVLPCCFEGDELKRRLGALAQLTRVAPINLIDVRRRVAERLLAAERCVV